MERKEKILGVLGLIVIILLTSLAGKIEYEYTMEGWVYSNNTVEDTSGNIWGYDTEIEPGTKVKIIFNNAGTERRSDDEVLKIKIIK